MRHPHAHSSGQRRFQKTLSAPTEVIQHDINDLVSWEHHHAWKGDINEAQARADALMEEARLNLRRGPYVPFGVLPEDMRFLDSSFF